MIKVAIAIICIFSVGFVLGAIWCVDICEPEILDELIQREP